MSAVHVAVRTRVGWLESEAAYGEQGGALARAIAQRDAAQAVIDSLRAFAVQNAAEAAELRAWLEANPEDSK
jgi:hypothetical protein